MSSNLPAQQLFIRPVPLRQAKATYNNCVHKFFYIKHYLTFLRVYNITAKQCCEVRNLDSLSFLPSDTLQHSWLWTCWYLVGEVLLADLCTP